MPRIRSSSSLCSPAPCLAGSAGAAQALASHGQIIYFEASTSCSNRAPAPHAHRTAAAPGRQSAARRALLVRRRARRRPARRSRASKRPTPRATTGAQYDAVLAEAKRLGWPVLLTVTSPVPRWATSNRKAPYVTRPDDRGLPGIHDRRRARVRLGGLDLLDLERAQRPGVPAAAVELQRHARLAAHLPRPLPGRLRGPAGGRDRAPAGAVRRNRAGRLRHGQRRQRRLEGAAARGGAAGVHARSAVPERQLQESRLLQRAADDRLRPPRLHAARRPLLRARRNATT